MQKIGIIGAMQHEIDLLRSKTAIDVKVTKGNSDYYCGKLCGKEIVLVQCGIGKVNAALSVQILADEFNVSGLINIGTAGSLNSDINICDIVVSTDTVQHDMDVCGLGFEPGEIPFTGFAFEADDKLSDLAVKAGENCGDGVSVYRGRILSGDQFINSADSKEKIIKKFGGLCTEMEGAAIAQAAYLNKIPFIIIRAISDKADGSADMDYERFCEKAADHSACIVMDMLNSL